MTSPDAIRVNLEGTSGPGYIFHIERIPAREHLRQNLIQQAFQLPVIEYSNGTVLYIDQLFRFEIT
jgi:hypothetical protein